MEKKELAVGDSTRVELIFSTGHYASTVRKSARILCNATGTVPRLTIAADVRRYMDSLDIFTAEPYKLDLDKDRPGEGKRSWEYELSLKNLSDEPLKFSLVSKPDKYVDVDFPDNKSIRPGKERSFKIRFTREIAEDVFSKSITIEASDAAKTRLTIPIVKSMRWGPAPTSQR